METYSVILTSDSTTFITTIDYKYEGEEELDEDKLYDLAIARIKDEEGIDLSNRRLDFTYEEIN